MNPTTTRREALKLGGVTLSLGAIIAACGDDRGGDTAPGRVGNAPAVTEPPDYEIDDGALLRTASSVELTAADLYRTILDLDVLDAAQMALAERLIENHTATAEAMGELTSSIGAEPYECANSWIAGRELAPVLEAIRRSDQPLVDVLTVAISFENIATATHQDLAARLTTTGRRQAAISAAALDARHAAWLAVAASGVTGYFTPALLGEEVEPTDSGVTPQFAINSRFGSLSQIEVIVGPPDENDAREKFTLRTPAENAIVYNEYGTACG